MAWARSRLENLIHDIEAKMKPDTGTARITGMKDLSGDVRHHSIARLQFVSHE